jgi:N-acyl homoserine lactone hydrolase
MNLHLLTLGEIRGLGGPIPGYLVITDGGDVVVIDTGPLRTPPAGVRLPLVAGVPLEDQLARMDITPADVRYVVCTHLDPDHAGAHDVFAGAEFVIQRRHLEAARSGSIDRLLLTRPLWDGLRFTEVDGDTELAPGLELIESGGHVPGHQSVLVRLAKTGAVLLAADALPLSMCQDPDTRPMTPFDLDPDAVRASTRRLAELAAEEKALVVYGHDPAQWPDLVAEGGHYD